jgi:hypothetical protein
MARLERWRTRRLLLARQRWRTEQRGEEEMLGWGGRASGATLHRECAGISAGSRNAHFAGACYRLPRRCQSERRTKGSADCASWSESTGVEGSWVSRRCEHAFQSATHPVPSSLIPRSNAAPVTPTGRSRCDITRCEETDTPTSAGARREARNGSRTEADRSRKCSPSLADRSFPAQCDEYRQFQACESSLSL